MTSPTASKATASETTSSDTTASEATPSVDLTAAPRAVLRESVRLLYRVFGERTLRTARGNAWEAVCADRERAADRDKVVVMLESARRTAATHR